MRIVAGTYGSRSILPVPGQTTRPTADKVRGAIFNALLGYVEDAVVLDLYAGTGAMALEAISRGAKKAYLCDHHAGARKVIAQNIQALGVKSQCTLLAMEDKQALAKCRDEGLRFDLIILDPPYNKGLADAALACIAEYGLLAEGGRIVVETDEGENISIPEGMCILRQKTYGRTEVYFVAGGEDK